MRRLLELFDVVISQGVVFVIVEQGDLGCFGVSATGGHRYFDAAEPVATKADKRGRLKEILRATHLAKAALAKAPNG